MLYYTITRNRKMSSSLPSGAFFHIMAHYVNRLKSMKISVSYSFSDPSSAPLIKYFCKNG